MYITVYAEPTPVGEVAYPGYVFTPSGWEPTPRA